MSKFPNRSLFIAAVGIIITLIIATYVINKFNQIGKISIPVVKVVKLTPEATLSFSSLSGSYFCSGTEHGNTSVPVGTIIIDSSGSFSLMGMYVPGVVAGRLAWTTPRILRPITDTDIATITIEGETNSPYGLHIQLTEGIFYSHADTGYMKCIKSGELPTPNSTPN